MFYSMFSVMLNGCLAITTSLGCDGVPCMFDEFVIDENKPEVSSLLTSTCCISCSICWHELAAQSSSEY